MRRSASLNRTNLERTLPEAGSSWVAVFAMVSVHSRRDLMLKMIELGGARVVHDDRSLLGSGMQLRCWPAWHELAGDSSAIGRWLQPQIDLAWRCME